MLKNEMQYGAVYAKIMGIYQNRLRERDFQKLASFTTVLDVAVFLKDNIAYRPVFKNEEITALHRGDLENILRSEYKKEYERFFRFVGKRDRKFITFFQSKAEIDEILKFIRLFHSGRQNTYICGIPENYIKDYPIEFHRLRTITTYDQFLELTKKSTYYDIFVAYKPAVEGSIDVPLLDTALFTRYYEEFYDFVQKEQDSKIKDQILLLLETNLDIMNISRILRMKKYYKTDQPGLYVIQCFRKKSRELMAELARASDIDSAYQILEGTRYQQVFTDISHRDFENKVMHYEARLNRKLLRLKPPSVYTIVAYLNLKLIEIETLINIVEGIRYRLPKENIEEYII